MKWLNAALILAMAVSPFLTSCGGGGSSSTSGGSTSSSGGTSTSGGTTTSSGGSNGSGTATTTVSFTSQIQPIFDSSCRGSVCHSHQSPVLSPEQSYDNLVNVASVNSPGMTRVIPYNPDNSVLYLRISGRTLGSQMPKSGGVLADSEIAIFRTWIEEGAQNN